MLFLHLYSDYHSISIQNQCRAVCDNQSYVNKLNWLLEEDFHHHVLHKETENEALQLIIHLIPKQFSIQHILGHQDSNTSQLDLIVEAKLNITADKTATTNAKLLINTHMISSPFEVYVNGQYTHHNIDRSIGSQSHQKVAKKCLISKYIWNTTTFSSIAWDHYSHIINSLPKTNKRFNLSFIYHRLPIGRMQFNHDH